jgi:hypothetical protein
VVLWKRRVACGQSTLPTKTISPTSSDAPGLPISSARQRQPIAALAKTLPWDIRETRRARWGSITARVDRYTGVAKLVFAVCLPWTRRDEPGYHENPSTDVPPCSATTRASMSRNVTGQLSIVKGTAPGPSLTPGTRSPTTVHNGRAAIDCVRTPPARTDRRMLACCAIMRPDS